MLSILISMLRRPNKRSADLRDTTEVRMTFSETKRLYKLLTRDEDEWDQRIERAEIAVRKKGRDHSADQANAIHDQEIIDRFFLADT